MLSRIQMSSPSPRCVSRCWAATCERGSCREAAVLGTCLGVPSNINIQGVRGSCFPIIDTQTQRPHTTDPFLAAGSLPFFLPLLPQLAQALVCHLEGTWPGDSGLAGAAGAERTRGLWLHGGPPPKPTRESPRQAPSSRHILQPVYAQGWRDLVSHWVLQLRDPGQVTSLG